MLSRARRRSRGLAPWVATALAASLLGLASSPGLAAEPANLRMCEDPSLQSDLERTIARLGLAPAVADHRLAVALVDLAEGPTPRLAMLNGDEMMYAASLPKIAILLGAFVQAERGHLALDGSTVASLNRMIRHSSNADASVMLERVGEEDLLDILTSSRYRFYDPATGGGLWVGKPYGKAPAYHRDPLRGLSHAATVFQVARLYYMLEDGTLLPPDLSRQMKATLAEPAIHHKFVKGLESRPDARLFRKSGTWRQYHADSALVEGAGRRYILVGLAQDPQGSQWLERLAAPLDDLVAPPPTLAAR